jgi:hypothetical protein
MIDESQMSESDRLKFWTEILCGEGAAVPSEEEIAEFRQRLALLDLRRALSGEKFPERGEA